MVTRTLDTSTKSFRRAVLSIERAVVRPEVRLEEVPAPTRLAPQALALTGEVHGRADDEDELASGRFVLLHDPSAPEPWDGVWRVVTLARARMEPELDIDPALGQVGWSWLMDSLTDRGLAFAAEGGTVTRVLSERFGSKADEAPTVDMEIRASWTPLTDEIGPHLGAWADLLCTVAGLPPLPPGVVVLPGQRR